jgi:four helix bundle protein
MTKPWDLGQRTAAYATDTCLFCRRLPQTSEIAEVVGQLRRAARGVAAGYRAARRARSSLEFVAKLGTVIEEADEAMYWLEHMSSVKIGDADEVETLRQEALELVAIFVAARKKAKSKPGDDFPRARQRRPPGRPRA